MDALEAWARKIQAADRRAIARAISAVESEDPNSIPLLKLLFRASRRARIIGVTGASGAGKSTLVDKLAAACRQADPRVGVLAIDPTSPFTGGAILGDRIRMQGIQGDDGIHIRSMATRGRLGGLAPGAADAITIFEAAGCHTIFLETVGVGQDEVEIAELADVVLLLLVPGMGDDVQAFKAGIMEIADVFVINKADRGDAAITERQVAALLSAASSPDGWRTPIIKTSAATGEGVEETLRSIQAFREYAERTALGRERQQQQWRRRITQMARRRLLDRLTRRPENEGWLTTRIAAILDRETDPYSVAEEILQEFSR